MIEPCLPEESIFGQALDIKSATERNAFLDRACAHNPALRAEVEALLRAHGRSGDLLDLPEQTPTTADLPAREGQGTLLGPYKLLEQIGEGGMGTVWMAEQTEPIQRRVAVKVVKEGMDSRQVLARFEAERQALALMEHPNIAKVLDAGQTPAGRPYFVMELVKGQPITRYCDERRLSVRERLELFGDVCHAVQHAHQKGIIHRDLKPSNVLVAPYDGKPVVKVIDFGVAKATGQRLTDKTLFTGFGALVGTPEYMSPEQAEVNNQDIDTRSDIYALGVLLYELLTGSTPLTRKRIKEAALLEVLRVIREEEPPRPSTRLSESKESLPSISAQRQTEPAKLTKLVRGELDWMVMKALEKDRNRRYETANGFAMDVQRYLADEPVEACPPSASYRLRKFLRRRKGPVLAATLLFLALSAGILGTTFEMIRAEQALGREEEQRIAAENSANEARSREAETQGVLGFVEDRILGAVRPEGWETGQSYDVKLADALKAALPFVDKSFVDQPLIEARLRMKMGNSFWFLADFKTAMDQQEKARTLYTQHRGPDHLDTLLCVYNLGYSYQAAGRTREALGLFEETLQRRKAALGPDAPLTLATMNKVAECLLDSGRTQEALTLFEETLKLRKAKLGPDHVDTLLSMNNLAICYAAAGRAQESLKLREETLKLRKAKLGANHAETLVSMRNLADAYADNGRLEEAVKLGEETLPLMKAKMGPNHPYTLMCMHDLAESYAANGRALEALKLREATLPLLKARLGVGHRTTLLGMNGLALSYTDTGRIEEALKLFEETLQLRKAKLGPHHADTLMSMNNLAATYASKGRLQEAITLHEEALRLRKATLGSDHPDTLQSMTNLAQAYDGAGRTQEALKLCEEAFQLTNAREVPELLVLRVRYLLKEQKLAAAVESAVKLKERAGVKAGQLYDAACAYALCAGAARQAQRAGAGTPGFEKLTQEAMGLLRQAVARGYKDAAHMKQDKDLDALRERADFQKLQAELAAPRKDQDHPSGAPGRRP
jgi:serine/threonine protein kinase/tetratricopeptide (TPR) repeat protein